MSDSSEDEDLSRFREFVDTSFTKLINESRMPTTKQEASDNSKFPSHLMIIALASLSLFNKES